MMIFCVEDDDSIRQLMLYTLQASGLPAQGFADGHSFLEALAQETPQLITLDIMLPGMDGIQLLKTLRADHRTADIPVILCTAKGTEYDKVLGLDLGADDYLAKPFGMMELLARIKALLRRTAPKEGTGVLCFGPLQLRPREHTVYLDGKPLELTKKEYALLQLFLENPGRAYSRDQLLEIVWGAEYFGETRTVDVHIGTLRTKLGVWGEHIKTVRGIGYRLEQCL